MEQEISRISKFTEKWTTEWNVPTVTMRNESKFSKLLIGQFIQNHSDSVYKSCTFTSPGHNSSQPLEISLEHCNIKQLTKETHSVSETGLWPLQTLDVQMHYKPTETFHYTHFSSSHPFSVKKGFRRSFAFAENKLG